MNRYEQLVAELTEITFIGKMRCLEELYRSLEDLVFYLEAGDVKHRVLALKMSAFRWQLRERIPIDREEQWEWTFVWMKEKVLRSLPIKAKVEVKVQLWTETDHSYLPQTYHFRLSEAQAKLGV